jgi:hypothetical protein
MSWLDHTFFILLLLSIPLFYTLARWRKKQLRDEARERTALCRSYEQPWKAPKWLTLYGLIAMSHSHSDVPTPLDKKFLPTVQKRWNDPKRFALQRLLEKGIIPVNIRDGGIKTERNKGWGWKWSSPWITLPWYVQTKRRAYFDFIVPLCERKEVKAFENLLNHNQHNYAYTFKKQTIQPLRNGKKHEHGRGNGAGGPYMGDRVPMAVGAWSLFEILLPFWWDKVLVPAQGEELGYLAQYIRNSRKDTIPLLANNPRLAIRIEAGHWGYVELENFVLYAAQEARIRTEFPLHLAWKAAERELKRCGIATNVFFEPMVQDEDAEEAA